MHRLHKILFISFIALLTLPILHFPLNLVKVKPLDGSYTLASFKPLTIKYWFNESFQEQNSRYIEDHIGFRSLIIRIYNQLNYSLFHMAVSPGCSVGKDDQLYMRVCIDSYLGTNFVGKETIDNTLDKLLDLQIIFEKENKLLLFIYAPDKGSFYPEYISDEYDILKKEISNYEYYVQRSKELGINYIDLSSYFLSIKDTTSVTLYPKNGVHWSNYGMILGTDSIVKYIENKININIRDFYIKDMNISKKVVHPDFDAETNMNLLFDLKREPMPYPVLEYSIDSIFSKPKVLFISDSYYWQIYAKNIPENIFDWGGFWFYCKTAYTEKSVEPRKVDSLNVYNELMNQDVIAIMGSESTMHLFPYGFIDEAYDLCMPKDTNAIIEIYKEKVKRNRTLFNEIVFQAEKNNTLVEELVLLKAKSMLDEIAKTKIVDKEMLILKKIEKIRNNKEWLEHVKQKAKQHGITLDSMLKRDAEFIVNKELMSSSEDAG